MRMSNQALLEIVTTVEPFRLTQSWHSQLGQSKQSAQVHEKQPLAQAGSIIAEGTGLEPATGFPAPHFQ